MLTMNKGFMFSRQGIKVMHFRVPDVDIISAATEQKTNSIELWRGDTYIGKIEPTDTGIRLESDYIVSDPMMVVVEAVEPTALQINLQVPAKVRGGTAE